jgi:hypothetical protein
MTMPDATTPDASRARAVARAALAAVLASRQTVDADARLRVLEVLHRVTRGKLSAHALAEIIEDTLNELRGRPR